MVRHTTEQESRRRQDADESRQITQRGTRKVVDFGDSLCVTLPKRALRWTLEDSDISGAEVNVELYSDGEYRIFLPTE